LLSARLDRAQDQLTGSARLFASLDPDRVLQRGYVRVTGTAGATLTDQVQAAGEPRLTLHFRDGTLAVWPDGPRAERKTAPKLAAPSPQQGKLL
jgi:exodeoxyribonuclease VII large subunit